MTLHLRATVLPDGVPRDVFVVNGRITLAPQADARTALDGGYLVPGLVDAHAHLSLFSPAATSPGTRGRSPPPSCRRPPPRRRGPAARG